MADGSLEETRLVGALKALADENRLRIMRALRRTGCCSCEQVSADADGMCCCDIEELTGLAQSTVSHHLELLRRAGLVTSRKLGRWTHYRRNDAAVRELGGLLSRALREG